MNNFKEKFDELQAGQKGSAFAAIREDAFNTFNNLGFPTSRNEEWKYTRIAPVFTKEYSLVKTGVALTSSDVDAVRLPGNETANELVFVNGIYNEALSNVRSESLTVQSLELAAANEYKGIVS